MVVARIRMKTLALTALLLIVGAGALCFAQSSGNGSLTGKLTDSHSTPLGGAIVTLRNDATGVEVHTTTTKSGVYRFSGLGSGEYTLVVESHRLGRGRVDGIVVAAGHESRVQTAINFEPPLHEPSLNADLDTKLPEPAPSFISTSEELPTRLIQVAAKPCGSRARNSATSLATRPTRA